MQSQKYYQLIQIMLTPESTSAHDTQGHRSVENECYYKNQAKLN